MFTKAFAVAALASVAVASPAAVTAVISPKGESAPTGCTANYPGKFEITIYNVSSTTSNNKRDTQSTPLISTLVNGVLTDAAGRTGYIASNNQFQYDKPPQAGAIYTAGFSVCQNGSLALGNSAVFYQCLSGTFYNLYDDADSAQCNEVLINVVGMGSSPTGAASQIADGQVTGQAQTVACQITDGQVQGNTCTAAPVTQISDGQIQASTAGAVSQISDGQIQAATATTAPVVVSQITDGQVQVPTAAAVVSQISDGQIQAPTNVTTVASNTPVPFTGAASSVSVGLFSVVAGLIALAAL